MNEYVCVGVRIHARNVSSPIRVRRESVYEDKSVIMPRVKDVVEIFAKRLRPEKRKDLVEKIINQTVILDGRDKEVQDILDNAFGCYSFPPNNMIYLDLNYLENSSLVEHETIHFLGRQWVMCLPFLRRIVNQDSIAANVVSTLLDREDFSKRHKLGEADKRDFFKLRLYRMIPLEFQEGIKGLRKTCYRIGNYARERGYGLEFAYKLSK